MPKGALFTQVRHVAEVFLPLKKFSKMDLRTSIAIVAMVDALVHN